MRSMIPLLLLVLVSGTVFAERQPYSRYQPIVDRQMFGDPPDGFDPSKPPSEAVSSREAQKAEQQLSKEQEKLKSSIHFSMINVTPSGETAVGFTDSSDSKNPINYYLKVGEARNGWTVREADAGKGTMTIVKDDVEVSLSLGGNSAKGAGKTSAVGGSNASAAPSAGANSPLGSLRARRTRLQNERQAQTQAMMADFKKMMTEQKAENEKLREEEAARREEEKAAREAEREAQKAQLQDLKDQLTREREERKKAEEEKADSGDQGSEQDSNSSREE